MNRLRAISMRLILCLGVFFQVYMVQDFEEILKTYFPDKHMKLEQMNQVSRSQVVEQVLFAGTIPAKDTITKDQD